MIFKPELVEKILAGEKIESRRPVKEGKPCRYRAGRTYAVQPGRTKPGVGQMRVREVKRETLGEMPPAPSKASEVGGADSVSSPENVE